MSKEQPQAGDVLKEVVMVREDKAVALWTIAAETPNRLVIHGEEGLRYFVELVHEQWAVGQNLIFQLGAGEVVFECALSPGVAAPKEG